jgi:multidrug efflux system membrane fusion protein
MRRVLVILILLAAVAGAVIWVRGKETNQRAARNGAGAPVPVVLAKAQTQDVPVYLDALGTVQAFNTVTVRAMIDGPLIEVNFKEGQDVKTGDVLARIDPRPYQASLDQAVAKKAQDEANLANARLDLARYQKLAKTAYTSEQQADTQRATVAQLEAQVKQDQASIDNARTQLSYCTIVSPIDGRTGIRQIDQGNIIHTSDTGGLVVITQLHPISVVFTLPQQDLGAVMRAQQAGPVKVLAFPQGTAPTPAAGTAASQSGPGLSASTATDTVDPPSSSGPQLDSGVLAVVDNQVDQSTGTIKLKATFPNKQLKLWPGGFVTVQLLARTENGVTTVPPVAVQRGPNNTYVYVVDDTDTAHRRTVNVGYQDPGVAVIAQGLKPGDQVVVDGASRLNDGTKVTVAQPAAAPGAAQPPAQPSTAARHVHRHGGAS